MVRELSLRYFALEFSLEVFRFETFAWQPSFRSCSLGTFVFAWGLSLDIFRLDCFAWELSFRIVRLGTFAWYVALGNFVWDPSLWNFQLAVFARDLSLENQLVSRWRNAKLAKRMHTNHCTASVSHSYRNPITSSCHTHKTGFILELRSTFVPSRDTIGTLVSLYMRSSCGSQQQ